MADHLAAFSLASPHLRLEVVLPPPTNNPGHSDYSNPHKSDDGSDDEVAESCQGDAKRCDDGRGPHQTSDTAEDCLSLSLELSLAHRGNYRAVGGTLAQIRPEATLTPPPG